MACSKMKRAGALALLLLLFGFTGTGAQGLKVSYLEGAVQVRDGSSWSDLAVGDNVAPSASIKLAGRAFVQLKGSGLEITLARPGTYVIKDIAAARQSIFTGRAGAVVAAALKYLSSGLARKQGGTAGARAENVAEAEDEGWVESGAEVFLQAGKEYVKSGRYDKAVEQLEQALEAATEEEAAEIRFYLGYAQSMTGDLHGALKQLDGLRPGSSDAWAGDFVILKAKLLEDASAYAEAVAWLKEDGHDLSQDAQRAQLYCFLLGLGCQGAGDHPGARQAFTKAAGISRESDIGKAASEMLQQP